MANVSRVAWRFSVLGRMSQVLGTLRSHHPRATGQPAEGVRRCSPVCRRDAILLCGRYFTAVLQARVVLVFPGQRLREAALQGRQGPAPMKGLGLIR